MRWHVIGTMWLVLAVTSYGVDVLPDPVDDLMTILNIAGLYEPNEAAVSDSNSPPDSNSPGLLSGAVTLTSPENTPYSEASDTREQFRDIRQQFLLDQMKSIDLPTDGTNTAELDVLIQQIEALQVPRNKASAQSSQQEAQPEPMETKTPADPGLPAGPVTQDVEISADKSAVSIPVEAIETAIHPLPLADVLYRQGKCQPAFLCYQRVLDRLDKDNITDRQWVLFQMGNCCRQSDPQKAIQLYSELTSAYPNSKWTGIALSRQKALEWSQANGIDQNYFAAKGRNDGAE